MVIILIALCALAVYVLQNYIYDRFWSDHLDVAIAFSNLAVYEGEDASLTETISNGKWLPLTTLHVKFQISSQLHYCNMESQNVSVSDQCYKHDVFSMMPYTKVTRTHSINCTHRGFYEIKNVDIASANIFLTNRYVIQQPVSTSLYVYPRPLNTQDVEVPFCSMMGTVLTRQMTYEDPFEFRGVRDYQIYDSIKSINWKASAKTDHLLVNMYNYTAGQDVRIIVNFEDESVWKENTLLEMSIRMAVSLANRLLGQTIPVSMLTNGLDIVTGENNIIGAGSDMRHMQTINETLARIDLTKTILPIVPILDHERQLCSHEQISYVFISYTQHPETINAFRQLAKEHPGSIWILPLKKGMPEKVHSTDMFQVYHWEVFINELK